VYASYEEDCNSACQGAFVKFYSDCTQGVCGCFIYQDDACTNCDDIAGYFVVWQDNPDDCCSIAVGCETTFDGPCVSDSRLKNEIKTLTNTLENIMKMNPVEFDWSETYYQYDSLKEKGKLKSLGFIAQEMREIYPEVVHLTHDGYYYIIYNELNSVLVEGIKEQQVFIDDLENTITQLENLLND
jgi:hypothetical protein